MSSYKIGRVYKIIHSQSDIIYVGSTFNTLRDRWHNHKAKKNSSCAIHPYIQQYGAEQFKIILIKEYEVVDRCHLEAYEQLWMNKLNCINKNAAFNVLPKLNKQIRDSNYRENNKTEISKNAKQKKICTICNCEVRKGGFKRHERTKKHINMTLSQLGHI